MNPIIAALAERDGWACHYCRCILTGTSATQDHKVARMHGGGSDLNNLVLACRPCNSSKGTLPYEAFVLREQVPLDRSRGGNTPIRNIRIGNELWAAASTKAAEESTTVSSQIRRILLAYISASD